MNIEIESTIEVSNYSYGDIILFLILFNNFLISRYN